MERYRIIFLFLVLSCGTWAIPYNYYDWNMGYMYSDSAEHVCSINETTLEIIFINLRKLMYSGDAEHDIPVMSPFIIDDNRDHNYSKMGILKRLQLIGYDRFVVEEANVSSKCTSINFTLNIPSVQMKAEQIDLLGNTFYLNVNEKNTTIDGYIEIEPNENGCFFLHNIDIAWNYDDIEVSVTSDAYESDQSRTVANTLAKSLIKSLKPFDLENKEKAVESAARRVFKRIGCWTFSPENLFKSNDRI